MIATILLLPHAETRERLLAPGAPVYDDLCRAFGWTIPGGWTTGEDVEMHDAPPLATTLDVDGDCHIVLARSGAVVLEGVDRLARVLGVSPEAVEDRVQAMFSGARLGSLAAGGTVVLLDADGNEAHIHTVRGARCEP